MTHGPAPVQLTYAEARARVLAACAGRPAVREPLAHCAGRALRDSLVAPHALPPFRNAAMDGWAVRALDIAGAASGALVTLPVVAVIAAGQVAPRALQPGEAMRIMTGAALPDGADLVVPFEDGERIGDGADEACRLSQPARAGENVRGAGADLPAGAVALEAGRALTPHDLALAASLGFATLDVGALPRVAVFTTGDELLEPSAALVPGAIRDSNLVQLSALVREAPAELVLAERLPDDADRIAERVHAAFEIADVVLTVGGVSAGDFDPVKLAIARLERVELWRVAMRPGRPQAFGTPHGRTYFGLPGNPGSVACVFEALVRPALRQLQGFAAIDRPRVPVRAAAAIASRAGRTDFVRCTLEWREGALWATPAGAQVSGHLTPQARANALLIVPEPANAIQEGEAAEALLLRAPSLP